jgi:hypothetical protein
VKVTALRFEALAVVLFRIKVLWDVMLDHSVSGSHFKRTHLCLHFGDNPDDGYHH